MRDKTKAKVDNKVYKITKKEIEGLVEISFNSGIAYGKLEARKENEALNEAIVSCVGVIALSAIVIGAAVAITIASNNGATESMFSD